MRRLLKGLGPNVIALGIASFFTDFGAELVVPLLPDFLRTMGATPRTLGWIEGIADSLGKGLRLAARDALIADSSEPFARGKAFGFQKAMDHFGATLGPLLAMV